LKKPHNPGVSLPMKKISRVSRIVAFITVLAACMATTASLSAQRQGNTISLKNEVSGYAGTQDFYTYRTEGGSFNSKTDLDDQTLKIAPLEDDTKTVIRFNAIPLGRSSYGSVNRLALVLTFKAGAAPDTIMLHNLNSTDVWDEHAANYNTINGTARWSGADGKLIDAWTNTDGTAVITGNEEQNSTLTIEIHPSDASARKAVLDSWLDGGNQGMVICGISGNNEFYSSKAYNIAMRPELIIELSSY